MKGVERVIRLIYSLNLNDKSENIIEDENKHFTILIREGKCITFHGVYEIRRDLDIINPVHYGFFNKQGVRQSFLHLYIYDYLMSIQILF